MNEQKNERWEIAQTHEKAVWDSIDEKFLLEHSKNYSVKSQKILEEAKEKFKDLKKIKTLQIGCGPLDVINEIKIGEKHSIDPLADFYKEKFKFDYNKTNLVKGVGENLPYKDDYFDIVIFANVLDHTSNPEKVLSEIKRVLKPEGIVWLEAHFYQKGFIWLAKPYGFFKKALTGEIFNPCHPYMFQLNELKNMISKDFHISNEKIGEDIEKKLKDLSDVRECLKKEKFTRRFPAKFGLLGIINYSCICKKKLN